MKTFWCSIIGVAATGLMAATATAQVQPWDKQVNNQNRFKVLGQFGNAAALDQETGLVWEKITELDSGSLRNARYGFSQHIGVTLVTSAPVAQPR